ncbi:hypothetical protein DRP44_00900 [candidate division TA06 bacterium]|uniref:Translation initiation factor eIF-2B n=1 Tax=candidate division TA06 bacterium TaxID=2250710 RepID=A0A660SBE3_UNCT6|nr:MAG: hypothetical protein DRP44_00900 [candidate division TA06 bacterium]
MNDEFKILINEIKGNSTNGDIEIARMTIYFLLDHFSSLIENDIRELGNALGQSRSEMASIQNIAQLLIDFNDSPKILHGKLIELKEKTDINYTDSIAYSFISTLNSPIRVITISRSSTVKRVLIQLSRNNLIKNLFIIRSYPGLEGIQLHKELLEMGINSIPVYLAEINKYVPKIDIAISGADAITNDYIVNKLGTRLLFEYAILHKKTTIVFGNPLKRIVRDISINNEIFEKIPIEYVTKIYD